MHNKLPLVTFSLQSYLPKFVEAIWQLLVSTEKIAKHDIVSIANKCRKRTLKVANFNFSGCCVEKGVAPICLLPVIFALCGSWRSFLKVVAVCGPVYFFFIFKPKISSV